MAKPTTVFWQLAVVVAVASFLAACSGAGGPSAKEGLVLDNKPLRAPLVKAQDPPVDPPQVEIARWRGDRPEVLQRGVRYGGEWIVEGNLERVPEPLPMAWPETVAVEEGDRLFVNFGPIPEPEFIYVRVFGAETTADGTPVNEKPITEVECALTDPGTEHCIEVREGNVGVALAVPGGGLRHVTAWASWDVPLRLQERLGLESGDVYAAWLFRVRT